MKQSLALGAAAALAAAVLFTECTPDANAPLAQAAYEQPGIPLNISYSQCFGSPDTDQDGLTDLCEDSLAAAFAPTLMYNHNEPNLGLMARETRFAVRQAPSNKIVIAYLLSYYEDGGDVGTGYFAHHGDSEGIYLTVRYNASSQHWVLDEAVYSRHDDYGHYSAGPPGYPDALDYVEYWGGYPTAFVADSKHGNYDSVATCNNSGFWGRDDCTNATTPVRVQTLLPDGSSGNIGSATVPSTDCVRSLVKTDSFRVECYWTEQRFRGWGPANGGDATSYSEKLHAFGFFPPPPPPPINLTGPTQMGPRDYCWWYATAQFGTPPYTYNWQNGGFVETMDGTSRYGSGGPIWITVWVTDADGRVEYANTQADVDENMNGCN
jgi:hypothetical protein